MGKSKASRDWKKFTRGVKNVGKAIEKGAKAGWGAVPESVKHEARHALSQELSSQLANNGGLSRLKQSEKFGGIGNAIHQAGENYGNKKIGEVFA